MAAKMLTESRLANYLRVTIPEGAANEILDIANGIVQEILGLPDTAKFTDLPYEVRGVLMELAADPFRNPPGATSRTKSIDDWTTTERWEAARATGVRLSDADRALLHRYRDEAAGVQTAARGSIQMHVPGYIR